jgi:hypothetical protein
MIRKTIAEEVKKSIAIDSLFPSGIISNLYILTEE